jgi:hypothetical protein
VALGERTSFVMKTRDVTALLSHCDTEYRFAYGEDEFARTLLCYAKQRYGSERAVRASPFARLLERPTIKQHRKALPPEAALERALATPETHPDLQYKVTFGRWGSSDPTEWPSRHQTSRPGENVVLQLNFGRAHNAAYQRLLRPEQGLFSNSCHPIHERHLTMSWARIDIEQSAGEATIEEVQNDWLREALDAARDVRKTGELGWPLDTYADTAPEEFLAYVDSVLAPHIAHWAEATLTATIQWLVERRGIRRIFYNTWETGNRLKGISSQWGPPRSLYSSLPRRFCFQEVRCTPRGLARCAIPKVQERLRDGQRGRGERLFEGGPFRAVGLKAEEGPRWWLLEV